MRQHHKSGCVHLVCLYQTGEPEQSRRTSYTIIESGRVSMGTEAPLLPQVFVVVNSMKTLIAVSVGTLAVILLSCLGTERLNEVRLVPEAHKPPTEGTKANFSACLVLKRQLSPFMTATEGLTREVCIQGARVTVHAVLMIFRRDADLPFSLGVLAMSHRRSLTVT